MCSPHPSWPTHSDGNQPAWGHPGIAVPCQAGLPAGTQTQLCWLQEQETAAKGCFPTHPPEVCPWPAHAAVFQGHTPAPQGYSKAHPWLNATPLPALGSEAGRHRSCTRRNYKPFSFQMSKAVFFSSHCSQVITILPRKCLDKLSLSP